ncbi:MAG TPA: hypothetical protein VKT22_03360 [Steroidobacteraceae bacterium]|nr:hypothetical protein [Steroidobacteraceae bacterium]
MSHYHSVVWIDHQRATVWQFSPSGQEHTAVRTHSQHARPGASEQRRFFESVAQALAGTHEILILGPARAKNELADFLRTHHGDLARGIVAVESADHPSDGEILAYARRHFTALDRMGAPAAR